MLTIHRVGALLSDPELAAIISRLARPLPLPDGHEPEERVVVGGIGWDGYLGMDAALRNDRPGPRFYYLDGDLELTSTSEEHERIKEWIGGCLDIYFEERNIRNMPRGQATLRLMENTGAEPDKSWCIGEEKSLPDVVLEIALTSGGLSKLAIYQRFGIAEVWIWRRSQLEVHALQSGGAGYQQVTRSMLLPELPVAAIEQAVVERDWLTARRGFRAALAATI